MLVTMAIGVFTSRVVLRTLGVEDFGIYNVVSGVVVLFSFINNALATGTQRHLSYELGKPKSQVSVIFSACLKIHILLGVLVLLVGEFVGVWFLNTKLNIPCSRLYAANISYQLALLICFISIVRTPYDATVIAFEKMGFYAYMSIFDACAKLFIVYALLSISYDKLVVYSILMLLVCLLYFLIQLFYVHIRLCAIRWVKGYDRELYRYILSFSGWTLFGSTTGMIETQGLNMIANIFYGVGINAAVGIANQVRGILSQFVNGFQQALNPQLVMSESEGNRNRQFALIYQSSKLSYFIMYVLSLPIMANIGSILHFWLGNVPKYTEHICLLVIIVQLFECLSSPLYTTIFAIGQIKKYQIWVASFRLLSFCSALVICNLNIQPYFIYVMPCVVACMLLIYRLFFIQQSIALPWIEFLKKVLFPVGVTTILSIVPVVLYKQNIASEVSLVQLILETMMMGLFVVSLVFFVGLSKGERTMVINVLKNKIKR